MKSTIDAMKQALEALDEVWRLASNGPEQLSKAGVEHLFEARSLILQTIEREEAQTVELMADSVRYRRLRLLGCAPMLSENLAKGTVLRFSNLDQFVDNDIRNYPGRGDGPFDKPESDAELALRAIASALGVGGHNALFVDARVYERKILAAITHPAPSTAAPQPPQGE